MNARAQIQAAFKPVMDDFGASPPIAALREGRFELKHYKGVLREIYHYAKEDPQLQALVTVYFRGEDRAMVKMFLRHATSEIGHDLMALEDLRNLGEDVSHIPHSYPLPTTMALTAYPFYQVNYLNPMGYLGYLYFLEHMPTSAGTTYAEALKRIGVPEAATSFLREHMTVDVAHNRLMDDYLSRLIRTQSDVDSVIYGMRVTGSLYANMLSGAMIQADRPLDYGLNPDEVARSAQNGVPAEQATQFG